MYRIRQLRLEKKKSMAQVARELNMPYTTYVNYETEQREPNSEVLISLADYFNCSVDYLIGRSNKRDIDSVSGFLDTVDTTINTSDFDNVISLPETKEIPLLGTIACGEPILAEENIDDYVKIDKQIKADFALRCKGDSMINARINDGDIVYIHQQSDVENGEIAAVLIGDEATLKKIYKYPEKNMIILKPANPDYEDFIYIGDELESIRILGKAVGFYSNL